MRKKPPLVLKRPPVVDGDVVRIQLTRGKVATIDRIDQELAQFNWYAMKARNTWYAVRAISKQPNLVIHLLHREVAIRAGLNVEGVDVDHVDGNGLDCRRLNLRAATREQNCHNTPAHKDSRSGVKGVSWSKERELWEARIMVAGVVHRLGRFADLQDATEAYRLAANQLHGEFARVS